MNPVLLFSSTNYRAVLAFFRYAEFGQWQIENIDVAELEACKTVYKDLNDNNVKRNYLMGEFRNRPIFILKAL